jgi:hypothetical protein
MASSRCDDAGVRRTPLQLAPLVLLAPLLIATPASAATPLASEVTLSTHTVHVGSTAYVASSIARETTSVGRLLVRDPKAPKQTSVEVVATVAEADRTYVTIVLTAYSYTAGAAHGRTVPSSLVFQRSTGRRLGLADLFRQRSLPAAVTTLAAEVRRNAAQSLGSIADPAALKAALAIPTAEALGTFVPRPWGLEVLFAQGAIAAQAAGMTSVLVPWQVLTPLLSVPLPDLGGGVPTRPVYGGGRAVFDPDTLKGIARGIILAGANHVKGLTGRSPASYRLVDTRSVVAQTAPGVFDELQVTTLVPFANPSQPLTVLLGLGGDQANPSYDVIDVRRAAVGCGIVSSAYVRALRERCP